MNLATMIFGYPFIPPIAQTYAEAFVVLLLMVV
jgi:hypothetical protein